MLTNQVKKHTWLFTEHVLSLDILGDIRHSGHSSNSFMTACFQFLFRFDLKIKAQHDILVK